ncbi:MAG: hypothetical protein NDJ90_11015 [Oligoflexia bacterium]|nr:hypothetical protein [Oligoflexia bacterium]
MAFERTPLSKRSTVAHATGLVLLAAIFAATVGARAERGSYPSCSHPRAESSARGQNRQVARHEFLGAVASKARSYFAVAAFHAETLSECVKLVETGDARWFEELGKRPPEALRACQASLSQLSKEIGERWSPLRVALALAAPALREDSPYGSVASRIHLRPQHPFGNAVRMPALTADERREALAEYDRAATELTARFRARQPGGETRLLAEGAEARSVLQGLEPFRAAKKALYFKLLGELPLMAYLRTGSPGPDELIAALERIIENAKEAAEELGGAREPGLRFHESYGEIIEQVLAERPELCGAAETWLHDARAEQRTEDQVRGTVKVIATVGSFFGPTAAIRGASGLVGFGFGATTVAHSWRAFEGDYLIALSAVQREAELTDFEHLSQRHRKLLLSAFILAVSSALE